MNLATYVNCLKKYALNKRISNEEFFNALINTYCLAGEIDNKNKDEIYFDKSRTSLLLNNHEDVPKALREALNQPNIYLWTEENFDDFINAYINKSEIEKLILELVVLIEQDINISNKAELIENKNSANIFLADILIECIKLKNDISEHEEIILRNGANYVNVIYGDIFKYAFRNRSKEKNIIVIPVDTKFHTHITRKFEKNAKHEVSNNTLHGKFLERWEDSGENIKELSYRIQERLNAIEEVEYNICGDYPIGTIAVLENKSTIFYLEAISKFDDNNNAHSSKEDIVESVKKLLIFYDKYGEAYDLYIPLFGTGQSRADLSLQESFDVIKNTLEENKRFIHGNIHIVVYKEFADCVSVSERRQNEL